MGKGDARASQKMKQRKHRKKLKDRIKRSAESKKVERKQPTGK